MQLRNWVGLGVIVGGIALSFAHHLRYAPVFAAAGVGQVGTYLPSLLAAGGALGLLWAGGDRRLAERPYGRAAVWYACTGVLFGTAMVLTLVLNLGQRLGGETWFTAANWSIAGSAIGLLLANYDLRRSHAIAEARANQRTADRLAQRLSVLNRVLRHDVRNKANVVLGYAEAVEQDGGSDLYPEMRQAIEDLTSIADRARRAQEMIENDPVVSVDLSEAVAAGVAQLRDEHPAADVSVDGAADAVVLTYPMIRTVIHECLANAIEHNPMVDSDCRVAVDVRDDAGPDDDMVEVSVADNGPGIPDRERRVLSADAETPMEHSRGTSLWLARWVAEESGGDVSIETREAGGSRVRILLPAVAAV